MGPNGPTPRVPPLLPAPRDPRRRFRCRILFLRHLIHPYSLHIAPPPHPVVLHLTPRCGYASRLNRSALRRATAAEVAPLSPPTRTRGLPSRISSPTRPWPCRSRDAGRRGRRGGSRRLTVSGPTRAERSEGRGSGCRRAFHQQLRRVDGRVPGYGINRRRGPDVASLRLFLRRREEGACGDQARLRPLRSTKIPGFARPRLRKTRG